MFTQCLVIYDYAIQKFIGKKKLNESQYMYNTVLRSETNNKLV